MHNYQSIITYIENRTRQKVWLTQAFIATAGDPLRGLFLDRVIFWSDKGGRDDGFFWKKAEDWKTEIGFSYAQVTRISKELENMGLIYLKKTNANGAPTLHYKPNFDLILQKIDEQFPILDSVEIQDSQETNLDYLENRISTISNIEIQDSSISITCPTTYPTTVINSLTPGPVCEAVMDVCKLRWGFIKRSRELSKSLSELLGFLVEENAEAEEVRGFRVWKKVHHWTGNSPPSLKQVGELWGQYQDWIKLGRPEPAQDDKRKNGVTKNGTHRQNSNGPLQQTGETLDNEPTFDPYSRKIVPAAVTT